MRVFEHKYYLFAISILAFIGYLITGYLQSNFYSLSEVYLTEKNNAWSHYSSKSIKKKIYEVQRNQILYNSVIDAKLKTTLLQNIDAEVSRYNDEQEQIRVQALDYDEKFSGVNKKTQWLMLARTLFLFSLGLVLCIRFLVDPMTQDRFYIMPTITVIISTILTLIGLVV